MARPRSMARVFNENLYDLPLVDPLDWELWERRVLTPYAVEGTGRPLFFATDEPGSYDAPDLASVRSEIEEQEGPPETIRLTFSVQGYYVNA
jgi:hypothetical protein